MQILTAEPDDIPAITKARNADKNSTPADRRTKAYLQGEHHPGHALQQRAIFYATEDGRVIGYIGGHLTTRFDCDGELQYLWVASEKRRSAIGSALFSTLAEWFQQHGAKRICVDVVPENDTARSFYKHLGAKDLNPHWLVWDDLSGSR